MDKSRIPEARIEPRYRSYCSEEYSNIKVAFYKYILILYFQ